MVFDQSKLFLTNQKKAEQFSPNQENGIILTTKEISLLKKDKTEKAFEV